MPFQKGKSGNPGGRKKRTADEFDLIAAARRKAPDALAVMEKIMLTGDSDRVRLSAAVAIVERAYGPAAAAAPGGNDKADTLRELADRLPD